MTRYSQLIKLLNVSCYFVCMKNNKQHIISQTCTLQPQHKEAITNYMKDVENIENIFKEENTSTGKAWQLLKKSTELLKRNTASQKDIEINLHNIEETMSLLPEMLLDKTLSELSKIKLRFCIYEIRPLVRNLYENCIIGWLTKENLIKKIILILKLLLETTIDMDVPETKRYLFKTKRIYKKDKNGKTKIGKVIRQGICVIIAMKYELEHAYDYAKEIADECAKQRLDCHKMICNKNNHKF